MDELGSAGGGGAQAKDPRGPGPRDHRRRTLTAAGWVVRDRAAMNVARVFVASDGTPFIKVYNPTSTGALDFSVRPCFADWDYDQAKMARWT
jgi:hypothetical protein